MKKERGTRRRMTDLELEEVKQKLLGREDELWQEVREEIKKDAREEYQELIQIIGDNSDRALAELEESTILSHVKLKVEEIEGIQEALRRMADGKYGRCLDCSRWIRPARLTVVPYAVRCIACQEKLERFKSV